MTRQERRAVILVSFVIGLRLLGIFLLLPVFSAYATKYPGATLPLVGVAFGIYALTQSILQMPFGRASDRFGRKPLLLLGLLFFSAGSVICAMAGDITQLIAARALQGAGAVSAVAMASLGDLTRPSVRAQAFTVTGLAVGGAFTMGIIGGPILGARFGLPGLFYTLAGLSFIAVLMAGFLLPDARVSPSERTREPLRESWSDPEVRRLYVASFVLSFVMHLFFFIYPLSWESVGLDPSQLWKVYLVVLLPTLLLVFPFVRRAERQGKLRMSAWAGWAFLVGGFLLHLCAGPERWSLYLTGATFFLGYTLLQALLPAFLTQRVRPQNRGSVTGFYSLASFLGLAAGGMAAGALAHFGHAVPLACAVLGLALWPALGLPNPPEAETAR